MVGWDNLKNASQEVINRGEVAIEEAVVLAETEGKRDVIGGKEEVRIRNKWIICKSIIIEIRRNVKKTIIIWGKIKVKNKILIRVNRIKKIKEILSFTKCLTVETIRRRKENVKVFIKIIIRIRKRVKAIIE